MAMNEMARLQEMTPEEQRAEIRAIVEYFDAREWDWVSLVSYHAAVFTGHWPVPMPKRKRRTNENNAI